MKFIISHSKTARYIEGSFQICGPRLDLLSLANQIREDAEGKDWVYGWIEITDKPPCAPTQEPVSWD